MHHLNMDKPPPTPRCLVIAATRNEGAFIVEWLAWYRALGFEVMILTNDCTDSSPALLDRFEAEGWVTHVRHDPGAMLPKISAHKAARAHPMIKDVDWVMVCDIDEFLVIHVGDTIQDVLGDTAPDFTGMAINWRIFGTCDRKHYEDVLQHEAFTLGLPIEASAHRWFKSIFRTPTKFKKFDAHGPKRFDGEWGVGDARWVNSRGGPVPGYNPNAPKVRMMMGRNRVSHANMQMNHYILRTHEDYAAKKGTPSASAGKDRYSDTFFRRFNKRPRVEDRSALTSNPAFSEVHEAAMALPGVAMLHHMCCAERVRRLCAVAGNDHEDDPRFIHHLEQARRLGD